MSNAITFVTILHNGNTWVFEDPSEVNGTLSVVSGPTQLIDQMARKLSIREKELRLILSAYAFPGHQFILERLERDKKNDFVAFTHKGEEISLNHQLLKPLGSIPEKVFIQMNPK